MKRQLYAINFADDYEKHEDSRWPVADDDPTANAVSSEIPGDIPGFHAPVLDLDYGAELHPSSTPGHFHLYLDKPIPWASYVELLDVLAKVGLIEPGYASASKARGATFLRLPGVMKELPVAAGFDPEPF